MFLEILNKLMNEKGLNKNTLAKESGIPYTTIAGFYKKGANNVKLSTLKKLADFFNVSVDYFIYGDKLKDIEMVSELQLALTSYLKSLGYIVRDIYEPSQIPIEEFKKQEKLYLVPEKYKNSDFVPAESHSIEIIKDSERYILGDDDYTELGNCIKECIAFKLWQKKKKVD